jgi:hypothetical protein
VSPTSALFKPNAFVPASVEDGPIGPGLLKARKRETEAVADSPPRAMAQLDEVLDIAKAEATVPRDTVSTPENAVEDEFSAFEASLPSPIPELANSPPHLPPPQTHTDPNPDPTHDLDISIFDSPLPTTSTSTAPPPPPVSASNDDPWSIFDTPAPIPAAAHSTRSRRSTSTTSTPPAFTRTPPRPVATPPKQPLTSATSSAQRRKAEEDEIIRAIVEGLPDLGYMLR